MKHTFKIGEEVKIISSGHPVCHFLEIGSTGTVYELDSQSACIEGKDRDGGGRMDQHVSFKDLAPIFKASPKKPIKQKKYIPHVGDRVRAEKFSFDSEGYQGKVGTVEDVSKSLIGVRFDDGHYKAVEKFSPYSKSSPKKPTKTVRIKDNGSSRSKTWSMVYKRPTKKQPRACKHLWVPYVPMKELTGAAEVAFGSRSYLYKDYADVFVICQHCLTKKIV